MVSLRMFHQQIPKWGEINLGDGGVSWRRYLYALLQRESLFVHAEV